MLSLDENVRNSSLTGLGLKGGLHLVAIGDLVELNCLEFNVLSLQQVLGSVAMGAPALGVDHDGIC